MLELRDVQHVVGADRIGIHDAVRHDLVDPDRLQCPTFGIRDHPRVHLTATL